MQLENARREIEYLKANRWTSGAPELSPITIRLGADTAKELGKLGMDYRNWDFDRLIDKWRTTLRDHKAQTSGMAAQKPLPDASSRSASIVSIPTQAFAPINQTRQNSPVKSEAPMPFTAPSTVNGDLNSDQLDAEGEDDDDDADLTPHSVTDEDPMNRIQHHVQPDHSHMTLDSTSMHPSQQMQSHMQAPLHMTQAHVQHAQAQAQAWAAARNQDFRHQHQHQHQHQQHQHQQLAHVHHINSANNSRRASLAMMDPHPMNANAGNSMVGTMGMQTGMEGIENHQDQFLRMDMGLPAGFVNSNDGGVSMA